MRHTLRLWTLAILIVLASCSGAGSVLAQSATSEAGNVLDPQVGDTVTYISEDGNVVATLTATTVVVDWDEFDEYYQPTDGASYLAIVVDVTNHGRRGRLEVRADDFRVQDIDGFMYSRSWADAADDAELVPAEGEVLIGAGDTESVVLVYEIWDDVELSRLYWSPDFERLLTIADLSTVGEGS